MLLLVFAIKILSPVFFLFFFYYIQFTNINKCKAGTSINPDTIFVRQIIIYIKIQVILEPFSPVLLLVFAIKILSPVFSYFFYNKQLKCPTVVSKSNCKQLVCSYFLHIFKSTNSLCTNRPNILWPNTVFQLRIECLKK